MMDKEEQGHWDLALIINKLAEEIERLQKLLNIDGQTMRIIKPTKPGPYIARSASDKTEDWPFWYVAGPDGNQNYLTDLGGWREYRIRPYFVPKFMAIALAKEWNGELKENE